MYDESRRRIGEVYAVDIDDASGRITRDIVRRGLLVHTETAIPAGLIASVDDRGITLDVGADEGTEDAWGMPNRKRHRRGGWRWLRDGERVFAASTGRSTPQVGGRDLSATP